MIKQENEFFDEAGAIELFEGPFDGKRTNIACLMAWIAGQFDNKVYVYVLTNTTTTRKDLLNRDINFDEPLKYLYQGSAAAVEPNSDDYELPF